MKSIKQCTAIMLILSSLASCGSFAPVYSNTSEVPLGSDFQTMRKGDRLRIKLSDSSVVKATLLTMNEGSVTVVKQGSTAETTEEKTILVLDIVAIEKWAPNPEDTVMLAGLSALVLGVIIFSFTAQFHPVSNFQL